MTFTQSKHAIFYATSLWADVVLIWSSTQKQHDSLIICWPLIEMLFDMCFVKKVISSKKDIFVNYFRGGLVLQVLLVFLFSPQRNSQVKNMQWKAKSKGKVRPEMAPFMQNDFYADMILWIKETFCVNNYVFRENDKHVGA